MGILNVGTQALQANLIALQTAGNNIANANVEGYSRQRAIMETVPGQYTGAGYIGKGVGVQTISRAYDEYQNRQATIAKATQAGDVIRSNYLGQLGDIFQGGTDGLGASINDMLNAFSDVASAPNDLTARTVVLTRVDETARRMRAASQSLDDLQSGIAQALAEKVTAVNTIAANIAELNQQIARAQGTGQPPNDLLDKRDQLIRDLNQYVQTTTIKADDGSYGIFLAGSQPLVLGTNVATLSVDPTIGSDDFRDSLVNKLSITRGNSTVVMDENMLGGGEISGLLRFQNSDLVEGRNLLGRLTLAVTDAVNEQHRLGLDLDGQVGTNIFSTTAFVEGINIMQPVAPATLNSPGLALEMGIADNNRFAASDYQVNFTSTTTGNVTRRADGRIFSFVFTPGTGPAAPGTFAFTDTTTNVTSTNLDGLGLEITSTNQPQAGDRFLLKPFSTAASEIRREFATPRSLAIASPVAAQLTPTNAGSLVLTSVSAKSAAGTQVNPMEDYKIQFNVDPADGKMKYQIIGGSPVGPLLPAAVEYVSGAEISYTPPAGPGPSYDFKITLTGSPAEGDSVNVLQNPYPELNGGNAMQLLALRDEQMFDKAVLSDGYAGLISQIGIRAQSANYSATVSSNIYANAEKERAGVTGVNLDEEAAKLLQYQQAYQASAKMIQIAQSIFDTLIQQLGR